MVNYGCDFCDERYKFLEEAKACESKGLIGPEIKPGLVLAYSDPKLEDNSWIFYSEIGNEMHDKLYVADETCKLESVLVPLQHVAFRGSDLVKKLGKGEFVKASDEKIDYLNKLIESKFKGTISIKGSMEKYGIKRLHNEFSFDSLVKG